MFNSARRSACTLNTLRQPQPLRTLSTTTRPRPRLNRNNAINFTNFTPKPLPRLQTRSMTHSQRMRRGLREASRGIWRKNPIIFPVALISVLGSVAFFSYVLYMELVHVGPQYTKFPPPVADSLRTAVYYTEVDLNPPKALNAYKQALHLAAQLKMHPYSDEVLGIRFQVSYMLEKAGLYKQAIEVLEKTKKDCFKFANADPERKPVAEKVEEFERRRGNRDPIPLEHPETEEALDRQREIAAYNQRQRTVALKRVVGINLKLAELYSSDHVRNDKKAEECQVAGVELCLKEMQRRQKLGIPVGGSSSKNDVWLNLTEISAALSELGDTYQIKGRGDLALPLYMRAADLIRADDAASGSKSCKQAMALCNIAVCMGTMIQSPPPGMQPAVSRDQGVDAAKQWASKAIEIAESVKPDDRDQLCDGTCVGALHALGMMAKWQGNVDEAKKYFQQARSLAKAGNFEEGIAMNNEALEELRQDARKQDSKARSDPVQKP